MWQDVLIGALIVLQIVNFIAMWILCVAFGAAVEKLR